MAFALSATTPEGAKALQGGPSFQKVFGRLPGDLVLAGMPQWEVNSAPGGRYYVRAGRGSIGQSVSRNEKCVTMRRWQVWAENRYYTRPSC
jgi:hypothetical protein